MMIRASLAAAQSEISWECPDKQASGNVDPGSMNLHAQIGLNVRFGSLADTQRPEKCEMAELGADNAP
jgi:hypothetical protein